MRAACILHCLPLHLLNWCENDLAVPPTAENTDGMQYTVKDYEPVTVHKQVMEVKLLGLVPIYTKYIQSDLKG